MSNKVLVVKDFSLPKTVGVHYRIVIITGEHKGESYFLKSDRLIIGRGDNVDIKIMDSSLSREHAELKKIKEDFYISDLGSDNGVVVNGQKVKQRLLKDNDRIVLGKNILKYNIVHVVDEEAPSGQEFNTSIRKLKNTKISEIDPKNPQNAQTPPKKNNRLLLILVVILGGSFLFFDSATDSNLAVKDDGASGKIQTAEKLRDELESVASKDPSKEDRELEKKLSEIFLRGLREEREGNYFRAINEYNLALIISPDNGRAMFYKKRTMDRLDQEIKDHFDNASRLKNGLHMMQAINENCAVLRLLQYVPEDERYKHADDNVKKLSKELGLAEDEINCLQK